MLYKYPHILASAHGEHFFVWVFKKFYIDYLDFVFTIHGNQSLYLVKQRQVSTEFSWPSSSSCGGVPHWTVVSLKAASPVAWKHQEFLTHSAWHNDRRKKKIIGQLHFKPLGSQKLNIRVHVGYAIHKTTKFHSHSNRQPRSCFSDFRSDDAFFQWRTKCIGDNAIQI